MLVSGHLEFDPIPDCLLGFYKLIFRFTTNHNHTFFVLSSQDHIQEILMKWEQLDDEIWSKIICMERNRRVAKAYARAEELTINGSDDGFNGYRCQSF